MIQIDSVSLILQWFRFKNEWFKYERDSWGFKLEDSLNDFDSKLLIHTDSYQTL